MKKNLEKNLLRFLFGFGVLAFINLIRKPPMKDWIIIFLLKSYIATFLDNLAVRKGYVKYPRRLIKSFDISVLFSYLLFPITCIYFNQLTIKTKSLGTTLICLAFSVPMALFESFLEKNTKLIKYKKSWTSLHSFVSIFMTFFSVRSVYKLINKLSKKQQQQIS
jgi:hypothetical protein